MNELVKVDNTGSPKVSGRNLHMFLEVKTAYKDWFPRMCEYGFVENEDFCSKMSESTGGRPSTDHELTIDMAKELCMIQRTDRGKEARRYFLQIEKDWNSPEKIMARALQMSNKLLSDTKNLLDSAKKQIENDRPKVVFANSVSISHTNILISELAKLIKQNGIAMGQKRLFQWMRDNKYLICRQGTDYNMPTQKAMDLGLFAIKETTISHSSGNISISRTPKVTGKGQIYFVNKFITNNSLRAGFVK